MFGQAGKKFALQLGDKVEELVAGHLASKNPAGGRTEKATESLGKIGCGGGGGGKRRVLLIGINYYGQQAELRGCINDVRNIQRFLLQNYQVDELLVLTDVSVGRVRPWLLLLKKYLEELERFVNLGGSRLFEYEPGFGSHVLFSSARPTYPYRIRPTGTIPRSGRRGPIY